MQKLNADETKELEDAMGKFKVGEPIDTTGLTPKIIAFIRTNELTKSDFAGTFLSQDGKKFKELGTLKKYRRWHNRKTFWKHRKDEAFWVLFFASISLILRGS